MSSFVFILLNSALYLMFGHFLKGKTAVITGSVSGIGLGIARSMAGAGANIVMNGFAADGEIKRIQTELNSTDQKAKFIFADVSKPADCRSLIQKSIQHFGQADILVNNAGILHNMTEIENLSEDIWEKVISTNLSAAFYTSRYALPGMKERKWGRIINIASAHGLTGMQKLSAYSAAKHGIVGLTKAAALENAKSGVTVNAICPGVTLTPMVQKQIDIVVQYMSLTSQQANGMVLRNVPSGEYIMPDDMGALATFLCSHNARQITGASYTVDGGWTAQ